MATDTLSKTLVDTMQTLFGGVGKHPGYRTTHAKGLLVEGTFTPTPQAKTLSIAHHYHCASTPFIARFSVGGGFPILPDYHDLATPKGVAIRFKIDENTHTDLISHSFDGFATRTAEDFLTLLQLVLRNAAAKMQLDAAKARGGDISKEQAAFDASNAALADLAKRVPNVGVFLHGDRPNPHTYGTITYYEPNTHILTNKEGKVTNVRYRLIPAEGNHLYTSDEVKNLPPDYLENDLLKRFPAKPIVLDIQAHIADPDDVLDDATTPYKSTTFIPIGKLVFNKVSDNNIALQKDIAFSPTPDLGGIKGIAPSKDPLIQARGGVYAISVEQRRRDTQTEKVTFL